MKKPVDMVLKEQFGAFLKANGYALKFDVDYEGTASLQIQFPNGDFLTEHVSDFSSDDTYEFDQEGYDRYVHQAKLSDFSEDEILRAKPDFWQVKK